MCISVNRHIKAKSTTGRAETPTGRALFTKGVAGRGAKAVESVISFPALNINQVESSANIVLVLVVSTLLLSPLSAFFLPLINTNVVIAFSVHLRVIGRYKVNNTCNFRILLNIACQFKVLIQHFFHQWHTLVNMSVKT